MFLPVGDSPNPVGYTPWINHCLIGANILIYLLISLPLSLTAVDSMDPRVLEYIRLLRDALPPGTHPQDVARGMTEYDFFVFEYGFKPAAPEIIDLFASMFLHGSLMHLAGNMLFLWIYGDNVEHRIGRANYLGVYIGSGLVATLSFAMFASTEITPLVGASGAISGVLGMYFLFFPRNEIKVFLFLFPFIFQTIWIRARWALGFYVVIDNVLPFVAGFSSNVAYGAHLGGFFAGLGIAWFIEHDGRDPSTTHASKSGVRTNTTSSPDIQLVKSSLINQDIHSAVSEARWVDSSKLSTLPVAQLYDLTKGLAAAGHDGLAIKTLRKAAGRVSNSHQDLSIIHLAMGELRLDQGQPTAAYQHLLSVLDLAPNTTQAHQAQTALRTLAQRGELLNNRW